MFYTLKNTFAASLCATLLLLTPTSDAALVSYNFNGTIDSGLLLGETYDGTIAFDDATLTYSGLESIPLSLLSFNFLSTNFTKDEGDFQATADFKDSVLLGINYSVTGFEPSFALIPASGSGLADDIAYFSYVTLSGDSGFGSLNFVSEPISAVLLGIGLVGFSLLRRFEKTAVDASTDKYC